MAMQAAAEKRQNKPRLRTSRGFWLWMLPVIFAYGLFKYWPMVYSFILSFADWNAQNPDGLEGIAAPYLA